MSYKDTILEEVKAEGVRRRARLRSHPDERKAADSVRLNGGVQSRAALVRMAADLLSAGVSPVAVGLRVAQAGKLSESEAVSIVREAQRYDGATASVSDLGDVKNERDLRILQRRGDVPDGMTATDADDLTASGLDPEYAECRTPTEALAVAKRKASA